MRYYVSIKVNAIDVISQKNSSGKEYIRTKLTAPQWIIS